VTDWGGIGRDEGGREREEQGRTNVRRQANILAQGPKVKKIIKKYKKIKKTTRQNEFNEYENRERQTTDEGSCRVKKRGEGRTVER